MDIENIVFFKNVQNMVMFRLGEYVHEIKTALIQPFQKVYNMCVHSPKEVQANKFSPHCPIAICLAGDTLVFIIDKYWALDMILISFKTAVMCDSQSQKRGKPLRLIQMHWR